MFLSVPSAKCEAKGDDDMVLPTHLICWLSRAPTEWDDEATLSDADFTGFTTPPEITFLEAFIHSSAQTMADSDSKKSINSALLQFLSLTMQWCCSRRMHLMEGLWKLPKKVPHQLFFRPTGFSAFGHTQRTPLLSKWLWAWCCMMGKPSCGTEPRHSLRRCAKQHRQFKCLKICLGMSDMGESRKVIEGSVIPSSSTHTSRGVFTRLEQCKPKRTPNIAKLWHRLPRTGVESLCPWNAQNWVDVALEDVFEWYSWWCRVNSWIWWY